MRITLIALAIAASAPAAAQVVVPPTVAFSVHDEPVDGLGDSFNSFTGLIRTQSTRADRACLEYDVSAFAGTPIQSATIAGTVSVNNAADNGPRLFDFSIYGANGTEDLTDYQITSTSVGTDMYHPPMDSSFDYSFDVTAAVQAQLNSGATFVGLRVEGTSSPNFPNILDGAGTLTITPASGVGTNYCGPGNANSTGNFGVIRAVGTDVAADNDLTLVASSLPIQSFGFFITSRTQGFVANPAGSQGNLCLAGAIGRYVGPGQIQQSDLTGAFSLALDLTQTPDPAMGFVSIAAGETWNFQAWHRDTVAMSATSNFTDGVSVAFQ